MSKPKFDPKKSFTVVNAGAKPAFDPSKPFEEVNSSPSGPSSLAQNVSKYARPALEFGGALGGGALAAAGGPLAAMGGGALGFAGGKAAADLLDRKLGIKPEISNLGEAAKETVQNIGEGVVTEATGQVMGAGAKALAKSAVPVIRPIVEKAKKFAVEITPAGITKSKPVAILESVLEKTPFSSGIIQRFRAKQGQQLERAAQSLIEDIATVETREATGTAAKQAIEQKMFQRLKVRDKLFNKLTQNVPDGQVIQTSSLGKEATSLLNRENALLEDTQNKKLSEFLYNLSDKEQTMTFKGAKLQRERFNELVGPMADTPEKKVYQRLKRALDEDIAAFAEKSGGNIEKAWKKANSFHGAIKQLADDPNIKSVVEKANPGAIVDSLLKSRNTLQMSLLRKAMPESSYQKVQGALVDRLFEGGPNQTASEALVSNLKRYGDEFLEVAITKPKLARLKEFVEVVNAVKGAEKMAGNPSGTAQNVITFAQGAFFITNPVKGSVAVIAPPVLAKIYLSDFGKKLITEGVRLSPQSARAAGVAGALISLSKKEQNSSVKKDLITPSATSAQASSLPNLPAISPVSTDKTDVAAYRSGVELFLGGDMEGAKKAWQKALKINPRRTEAQRGLERLAQSEKKDIGAYIPK